MYPVLANLKYEQPGDFERVFLGIQGGYRGAADIQLFLMQGERLPQTLEKNRFARRRPDFHGGRRTGEYFTGTGA